MALTQPNLFSEQIFDTTIIHYNSGEVEFHNQEPRLNPNFVLVAAATYLPKDNPERPKGEDAHFICKDTNTIGVADGVGGWIKQGIDSGIYSRTLMRNCAHGLRVNNNDNDNNNNSGPKPKIVDGINLRSVLEEAFLNTKVKGSSTACLVSLSGKILHAVNVGDSGFLVVRNGEEVIFQSPVQQRKFNHPFQLGMKSDDPSIAEEFEVTVEIGDVIVLGTDGLLDNMEVDEIIEEVKRGSRYKENNIMDLEMMSSRIANLALYNSFDRYSETPFSRNSKKAGFPFKGGKIDDITVIVAEIQG